MDKTTLEATINKRATNNFEDLLENTIQILKNNPILSRVRVLNEKLYDDRSFWNSLIFWEKSNFEFIKKEIIKKFEDEEIKTIIKENQYQINYKEKYEKLKIELDEIKNNNNEVEDEETCNCDFCKIVSKDKEKMNDLVNEAIENLRIGKIDDIVKKFNVPGIIVWIDPAMEWKDKTGTYIRYQEKWKKREKFDWSKPIEIWWVTMQIKPVEENFFQKIFSKKK